MIEVGQTVDVVVEHGVIKHSSIQDISNDRFVLLQVVPPLPVSYIGKIIIITYLTKKDRRIRHGFQAIITEICEGYVTVGRGFPAIIVKSISESEVCDLRTHERHANRPEIRIQSGTDTLDFTDISRSGAHLVRDAGGTPILKVGDTMSLTISIGNFQYDRQARIIRQWHTKGTDGPEHLAVIFTEEISI